ANDCLRQCSRTYLIWVRNRATKSVLGPIHERKGPFNPSVGRRASNEWSVTSEAQLTGAFTLEAAHTTAKQEVDCIYNRALSCSVRPKERSAFPRERELEAANATKVLDAKRVKPHRPRTRS